MDFDKKWKDISRLEKALQSLKFWFIAMKVADSDSQTLAVKIFKFLELCWNESPKVSRKKSKLIFDTYSMEEHMNVLYGKKGTGDVQHEFPVACDKIGDEI